MTPLYSTVLYHTALYCTTLDHTILCRTAQCCTILCSTVCWVRFLKDSIQVSPNQRKLIEERNGTGLPYAVLHGAVIYYVRLCL